MKNEPASPPKPEHLDVHREDDLVVATIRGAYDVDVARYLQATYVEQVRQYGYRLVLLIAHTSTTVTPEARRLLAEWDKNDRAQTAGAIVGASFTIRTVASLTLRATEIFSRKPATIAFFDSESDARVWLDKQRVALRQKR